MKYARFFLLAVACIGILSCLAWYFMGWVVGGAFKSSSQQGGLRQVFDVMEATMGATVARADSRLPGVQNGSAGPLSYYIEHPGELQRDKKYFETWHSALAIADASFEKSSRLNKWEGSLRAAWIPDSQRTDSWGHSFCVQSSQTLAMVVSPGPQAVGSLDCSTLRLSSEDLSKMPYGRLSPLGSGALVLVVKKSPETASLR